MHSTCWVTLFLISLLSCGSPKPVEVYTVQNVLMPLEPPITVRSIQSRAIRPLELPETSAKIAKVRLLKAEIGNPDFPNLNFARSIRLSLVDPDGVIILLADSGPISKDQATVLLKPVGKPDILRCFQQEKLDMLLEVDNLVPAEQGIMLIGNFEFTLFLD
ncbi:MAG: hypothetical protein IPJ40_23790 [Saprospirales bacterium]|nr:hypothetical protein [Saprospirales bacterium]